MGFPREEEARGHLEPVPLGQEEGGPVLRRDLPQRLQPTPRQGMGLEAEGKPDPLARLHLQPDSGHFFFKKLQGNVADLQLGDLLAWPCGRKGEEGFLSEGGVVEGNPHPFKLTGLPLYNAYMRRRLLTPGPVELHPKALLALSQPQLHHRTEEARRAVLKVRRGLKQAFQTEGEVLILTGSGTLALEALALNLFDPGERVLVPVTGKFSERWAEIALALGLSVDRLDLAWGGVIPPEAVARPGYRGLFLTHSETSTGALNDVRSLAEAFKDRNPEGLVVADMVTSLLLTEVALEAWGIDAAASGSQKGLMCPPGLSFAALSPRAVQALKPKGYYLNLKNELKAQAEGETAYTPAINLVLAVEGVLADLLPSLPEHLALKKWQTGLLYQVGEELGLRPVPEEKSPATSAFYLPEGVPYAKVKGAFARRNAVIAGGQGPLKGRIFRLSLMGHFDRYDALGVAMLFKEAWDEVAG